MGIFYLVTRAISTFVAFLYPAYETFKTLANRPGYERESPRWMMYWIIIAAMVAYEYNFEVFVSWFPFYHEVKTLFLLFLVLPQTQGSTIIYQKYLLPFLLENEELIDRQLASVQGRALTVIQEQFQRALNAAFGWQATLAAANAQQGPRGSDALGGDHDRTPGTPGAQASLRPSMPSGRSSTSSSMRAGGVSSSASSQRPRPQREGSY
ncbi:hypothetical protein FRB94_007274 [Tulasnella sp. JGI-2019a]|nr:hypothetical protein FRB93_001632 [Tulasnella sp. JGI-2019a]KAG8997971.1 hypothetical protein FRB94_007274 [Tulasnella sp. JGI-2019a]KAG9035542.1 hypothetical protein FRB95_011084 [Tulasnella sp. JGI-2019a]